MSWCGAWKKYYFCGRTTYTHIYWQPTPVFLPGESHGQRNLAGCGPWRRKESDMTEQLTHNYGEIHQTAPSLPLEQSHVCVCVCVCVWFILGSRLRSEMQYPKKVMPTRWFNSTGPGVWHWIDSVTLQFVASNSLSESVSSLIKWKK